MNQIVYKETIRDKNNNEPKTQLSANRNGGSQFKLHNAKEQTQSDANAKHHYQFCEIGNCFIQTLDIMIKMLQTRKKTVEYHKYLNIKLLISIITYLLSYRKGK